MNARPSTPLLRDHTLNVAVLPHDSLPTSSAWLQLCPIGNAVLMLARFTAQWPPCTRNESRPKNTVGRPDMDVSQPDGIHGWPVSVRSKSPFWSSDLALDEAACATPGPNEATRSRANSDRETAAHGARSGLGMVDPGSGARKSGQAAVAVCPR